MLDGFVGSSRCTVEWEWILDCLAFRYHDVSPIPASDWSYDAELPYDGLYVAELVWWCDELLLHSCLSDVSAPVP